MILVKPIEWKQVRCALQDTGINVLAIFIMVTLVAALFCLVGTAFKHPDLLAIGYGLMLVEMTVGLMWVVVVIVIDVAKTFTR